MNALVYEDLKAAEAAYEELEDDRQHRLYRCTNGKKECWVVARSPQHACGEAAEFYGISAELVDRRERRFTPAALAKFAAGMTEEERAHLSKLLG